MAKRTKKRAQAATAGTTASSVEELLLAALARGDESLETGRYHRHLQGRRDDEAGTRAELARHARRPMPAISATRR